MQVSELHIDDNALLSSTEQSLFRWLSKWLGKEVEETARRLHFYAFPVR